MDDIVQQAMAKWPDVPACRGWLGLDARGDWYLRDAACQAAGAFPQSRGSRLLHRSLIDFIARNYQSGPDGQWYFQNGPQQVFIELEAAPWILRIDPDGSAQTQAGPSVRIESTWLDECGRLFAQTSAGYALVHTLDMLHAAAALENGAWPSPQPLSFATMPERFGYVLSPYSASLHAGRR